MLSHVADGGPKATVVAETVTLKPRMRRCWPSDVVTLPRRPYGIVWP